MPTYEYACTECGHTFEQVQSFYDDALTHCPQCDGRLRKVFNAVGVVFKGSGFYHTDNRAAASSGSSGSSGSKEAASTSDSGSGEKAAAPSGTKSAAGSGSGSSGDSSSGSKATTSSTG